MKNIPEALDYRQILEQLQMELVRETQGRDELAIETSPDSLDQIQHASERDYAMGALERRVERLREVRDALQRIQQQTCGHRGRTGDPPYSVRRTLRTRFPALRS